MLAVEGNSGRKGDMRCDRTSKMSNFSFLKCISFEVFLFKDLIINQRDSTISKLNSVVIIISSQFSLCLGAMQNLKS